MASGQDPLLTLLGQQQQPQPQQATMLPQQGGVLPQTAAPQPQQSPDTMELMRQLAEQYQKPALQGEMDVARQMGPLAGSDQIPRQGLAQEPWMKMQPVTGQGFGGDVKGVLGDVGKALLLGLSATGPGRAVQGAIYGPAQRTYKLGQEQKAQRLEAMKTQAGAYGQAGESASRAIGGLAEADYRNRMATSKEEQIRINQQKADQAGQEIANNYAMQSQRLAQGWDRLEQGQQKIAIQDWYDKGVLQAMNARIAAGTEQNAARIQAQEDMKAAATQSGFATKYPILGALMGAVGVSPDLTSAPGAGQPKPINQPPKKAGGGGKATHIWTPQGLQPAGK